MAATPLELYREKRFSFEFNNEAQWFFYQVLHDENFYLPYMAKPGVHLKAAASVFKNARSLFLSQKEVETLPFAFLHQDFI